MKKENCSRIIVCSVLLLLLLSGCGEKPTQSTITPPLDKQPLQETQSTQPDTQPETSTPDLTEEAHNIILLIGDGMGENQRKAAQWYTYGMTQDLVMDTLPIKGWAITAALDSPITDSPAAGTAMATGHKTNKGRVSVYPDDVPLKTILEYAQERGMSVGLVTTVFLTDATPAVFAAHVPDRMTMRNEIASMILDHQVDVLLGGGEDDFLPTSVTGCYPEEGHREDGRNLIDEAVEAGYTYVCDASALAQISIETTDKLLGLFNDEQMNRPYSPSMVEMTQTAMDILSKNPNGFFLMVEGGLIDWACHANKAQETINDTIEFDEAVSLAVSFANSTSDTLVIVTADHETGGMSVEMSPSGSPDEDGPFSMPDGKDYYINWTTDYHTDANVPVSAMGPGSGALSGTYENTHIFDVMFDVLPEGVPAAVTTAIEESIPDQPSQPPAQLPDIVTESLDGAIFDFYDGFDSLTDGWYVYDKTISSDGMVITTGEGKWGPYWMSNSNVTEGMASLLLFKFSSNAEFILGHQIGEFGTPDYFFRGINEDSDLFYVKGNEYDYAELSGDLNLESDTWYYGLFAIGEGGEFLLKVWERDDLNKWAQSIYNYGDDWAGRDWWLISSLREGSVSIDDFYSFSFSGIK